MHTSEKYILQVSQYSVHRVGTLHIHLLVSEAWPIDKVYNVHGMQHGRRVGERDLEREGGTETDKGAYQCKL